MHIRLLSIDRANTERFLASVGKCMAFGFLWALLISASMTAGLFGAVIGLLVAAFTTLLKRD